MAARRRSIELPSFFTFGGRVPPSVGLLLAVMLVASVLGWMNRALIEEARLAPVAIQRGQVWRLVTWPFFQDDPFTLLFGGFMLWWLGPQLSHVWSEQRFLWRFFVFTIGAGLGTTLLALVWDPASWVAHAGVWPVVNALLVAWAMLFPDRQVNIWGVLPLTGRTLAILVAAGTGLYAIAGGWPRGFAAFSPHLLAIAIAWAQARGVGPGRGLRQARRWWSDREQRRRAGRFKVVRKDGSGDGPRWMN